MVGNLNYPSVAILMTTYNGGQFLEEQIQSLVSQKQVVIQIYVNDDGSTDNTLDILQKWKDKGFVANISRSDRIGPNSAFQKLLQENLNKEYIAFCDQDDIWSPNKLTEQIRFMTSKVPTLVFTDRELFTKHQVNSKKNKSRALKPSFQNALLENVAPGNTILINKEAARMLSAFIEPRVAHYDAWFYLIISSLGQVQYVKDKLVKYRLHDNNLVGIRSGEDYSPFNSLRNYFDNAQFFHDFKTGSLGQNDEEYFSRFISLIHERNRFVRLSKALKLQIHRQKRLHSLFVRIFLLAGILFGKI